MKTEAPRVVPAICQRCGCTFGRRVGRVKKFCHSCAIARVVEAGDYSRAKSGEQYEGVVRKQLAYWRAEAKRLGIRA